MLLGQSALLGAGMRQSTEFPGLDENQTQGLNNYLKSKGLDKDENAKNQAYQMVLKKKKETEEQKKKSEGMRQAIYQSETTTDPKQKAMLDIGIRKQQLSDLLREDMKKNGYDGSSVSDDDLLKGYVKMKPELNEKLNNFVKGDNSIMDYVKNGFKEPEPVKETNLAQGVETIQGEQEGGWSSVRLPEAKPFFKYEPKSEEEMKKMIAEGGPGIVDTLKMAANTIPSAWNILAGLGNVVLHPIDTGKGLLKTVGGAGVNLGKGALKLATGKSDEELNKIMYSETNPVNRFFKDKLGVNLQENEQVADQMWSFLVDRYGSLDNVAKTVHEDPVGVIGDVVGLLEGGVGMAGKAGLISETAKAGILSDLSKINPYTKLPQLAGKGLISTAKGIGNLPSKIKLAINPALKEEDIIARISQGNKEDMAKISKAMQDIDTSELVKNKKVTYEDFNKKISSHKEEIIDLQNKVLETEQQKLGRTLGKKDFDTTITDPQSGLSEKTNYVEQALNGLQEHFQEAGDVQSKLKTQGLIKKFNEGKLTLQETNQIARDYNKNIGYNAYDKMGNLKPQPRFQNAETIRSGVKEASRQFMGEGSKKLDEAYSNMQTLQDSTKKVEDAVFNLKKKIENRGILGSIGSTLGKLLDGIGIRKITTNMLLESNKGMKTLNSMAIENQLQSLLEKYNEINGKINKTTTKQQITKYLEELQQEGVKFKENVIKESQLALPSPETATPSNLGTSKNPIVGQEPVNFNQPETTGLPKSGIKDFDSIKKQYDIEISNKNKLQNRNDILLEKQRDLRKQIKDKGLKQGDIEAKPLQDEFDKLGDEIYNNEVEIDKINRKTSPMFDEMVKLNRK